jgi:hypothetical protein
MASVCFLKYFTDFIVYIYYIIVHTQANIIKILIPDQIFKKNFFSSSQGSLLLIQNKHTHTRTHDAFTSTVNIEKSRKLCNIIQVQSRI